MNFFKKLFRRKSKGLTGMLELHEKSISVSVKFMKLMEVRFDRLAPQALNECDTDEAKDALFIYAMTLLQIKEIDTWVSELYESNPNDLDAIAKADAATLIAHQRLLIAYAQTTSDNPYAIELQSYIDKLLVLLDEDIQSISLIINDLNLTNHAVHIADSMIDKLFSVEMVNTLSGRVNQIIEKQSFS
ncbi:hypothetical protein FCV73_21760 [Vibrio sp. F13]|uniref:hypothetical protein n=1 Tax=unclassified Vibrio TaxID=2614977 RepID=UPI0010BDC61A|nr:hypothetical protein [Vibrio sp. F13]TKF86667.1 hypothetical protein FCV73_21760 [Vibrio sp. F13]